MFAHSIIREATYDLLQAEERLTLHAQAARILADGGAESRSWPSTSCWQPPATIHGFCVHCATRVVRRLERASIQLRFVTCVMRCGLLHRSDPATSTHRSRAKRSRGGEVMSLHRFEQALDLMDDPAERADALYSLGETSTDSVDSRGRCDFRRGAELFDAGQRDIRMRFDGARGAQKAIWGKRRACRLRRSAATALITAWF